MAGDRERRAAARSRSAPTSPIRARPTQLFERLEAHFGWPVLALVNNAGITADDLTPSLGDEAWDAVIDTDLTAAFRLTRRALQADAARPRRADRQHLLGRRVCAPTPARPTTRPPRPG